MNKTSYTRRDVVKAAGLTIGTLAFSGCSADSVSLKGKSNDRPNILFIMSDDHAAQAISAYQGFLADTVKTPNIDRLAKEGLIFNNCFCTNSICTPSRASILTGKYSHKNGCLTLADSFDNIQDTFPKLLQKAGYYTAVIGKWHLATEPTGFDYYNVLPGQGRYFNPTLKEKGKDWNNAAEGWEVHKGYVTDVITNLTLKCLKNRPKDKPFCVLYHHKAPHDEWDFDPKYAALYENIDIPEPPTLFDDYSNRGQAIKRATQKIGMKHTVFEKQTDGLTGLEKKKRQYQIFIKKYLRCAASIDDNVGRVLDFLDASGLSENTIVVYSSDQGVFLGEHGLYDKRFMYEESLRMPLIVRWPHHIKPGNINNDIALNIDFAPTFLDIANLTIPKGMQGISLAPLLEGRTPPDWRKSMYYRYWMHGAHFDVAAHFGLRTERYKLIYYYGQPLKAKGTKQKSTPPEWELFDLQKDPREMNNVYDNSSYMDVRKELKTELIMLRRNLEDDNDGIVFDVI